MQAAWKQVNLSLNGEEQIGKRGKTKRVGGGATVGTGVCHLLESTSIASRLPIAGTWWLRTAQAIERWYIGCGVLGPYTCFFIIVITWCVYPEKPH